MFERIPDVGGPGPIDPSRCPECGKKHPKKYVLKDGSERLCPACGRELARRPKRETRA